MIIIKITIILPQNKTMAINLS